MARPSLQLSKYQIVGNHMPRLKFYSYTLKGAQGHRGRQFRQRISGLLFLMRKFGLKFCMKKLGH